MVCFDGETFGCVCETRLQQSSAASLNPPSHEPWKDAERVQFRNIPQARVSPAGSESRRRPFLYQSGVFAHFPLSCRLELRHSCKENRLHIWPVQRLLNLQLFLSSGPTGGPGFRPQGSARGQAKTKGRLRVWGGNKTDKIRRKTDLIHRYCFWMQESPWRNVAEFVHRSPRQVPTRLQSSLTDPGARSRSYRRRLVLVILFSWWLKTQNNPTCVTMIVSLRGFRKQRDFEKL